MARAIWKGSIAFGLVQIPVNLHTAEEPDELPLHLLDKHDLSPVGYERVNKSTGRKVEWKRIVRGYEYKKGQYVVLTDAELEAANVEATHTVDITDFVELDEIDPMYFEKPYYVEPTKAGRKAYALLRETLKKTGKAGIARVVIRTRQHVAALLPRDEALVLVLLRFGHELRDTKGLDLPNGNLKKLGVSAKEVSMAQQLVAGLAGKFDPGSYRDDYRDDLLALVKKKAKSGKADEVNEEAAKKPRQSAQVIDLMELLKQSVGKKSSLRAAKKTRAKSAKHPAHKTRTRHPVRKSA